MNNQKSSIGDHLERLRDYIRLTHLSAHLVAGRRFWIATLLPLIWPAALAFCMLVGWRQSGFEEASAQNFLIGAILTILAIFLGIRIIAGEMDRRTLEIAYTVPGGCHRVWLAKISACFFMLLVSEILLALATLALFTSFPLSALYGALQAAIFYMIVAMFFSALFRNEITGAMAAAALLSANFIFAGIVSGRSLMRISPFFNTLAIRNGDTATIFAWTLQNRILFVLLIAAITLLTFSLVEKREKMLGD